jgi:hypothetical protein
MNIDETVDERFTRWGAFLKQQQATPLLVLGLTKDRQLVLTTPAGGDDGLIVEMVAAALVMLKRGDNEPR